MLGEIYDYFLAQFASAEDKKGGQLHTPAPVVKTLVAVLSPHKCRIDAPFGGWQRSAWRFVAFPVLQQSGAICAPQWSRQDFGSKILTVVAVVPG